MAGSPARGAQLPAARSEKILRYSRRYRVIRKCLRTRSRPAFPIVFRFAGLRIHVDPRELARRRGVLAGTEDGGIVGLQMRREKSQHGWVRRSQIDVAAPDPLPSPLAQVRERSRLGIVDDDVVVLVLETGGVEFVEMAICSLHVGRQVHVGAL